MFTRTKRGWGLVGVAGGLMAGIWGGGEGVAAAAEMRVYFGTYTGPRSQGIYVSRFDPATGELGDAELAAATPNPSYLALHPGGRFLYAANEVGEFRGQKSGSVTAFRVAEGTGALEKLNEQPSHGGAPCHLVVDATGRWVLVANYMGGNVAALPIAGDGSLGAGNHKVVQHEGWSVNPQRQEGPHAHSINLDARNRFAVAADLGIDKLLVYRFDPRDGALEPHSPSAARLPAGSGPRHFAFRPNGRNAYVINEMLSTITAFRWSAKTGVLEPIQVVRTLPEGVDDWNSTAHIAVHPNGRFVYGSNRGHDSIAVFAADRRGELRLVEHEPTQGKTPRNFGLDPSGRWLLAANQGSDSVVVFRVDGRTGELEATGRTIRVGAPVCVTFAGGR
jgi:6-phosphogluconolactonase